MNKEQKVKLFQKLFVAGLVGIVMLLCYFVVSFMDKPPKSVHKQTNNTEKNFDTATSRIDFQEIWRADMESKEKQMREHIKILEASIKNQQKEEQNQMAEMQGLINNISFENSKKQIPVDGGGVATSELETKVTKIILNLTKREDATLSSIDNTIPAGSFAPAVLLSGVDATAAVSAGSNPRPMLLRLTDLTVLPRIFRSDLVDCHCTASAWGELSSERVHARLVKLSCIERDTGEVLEVPVNGFIAGPDGKEGVRGVVASKDSQFLTRSLWGGVFSGLGSALSPANKTAQGGAFLSIGKPDTMSTKDMFQSGFGESANKSLTKLSDYYIARAEQIQPVIQIAAGQNVDLVFTEGVAIDKTLIRKKMAERNDVERKKTVDIE